MISCKTCFEDYLVQCSEEINVFAQLAPLTDYTWIITDKFDRQYEGAFTTDEDGFWTIPITDLPEGLLTQFSGEFLLQVIDNTCKPIKFKIAQEYDEICFSIKGGTREKNTLGCNFACSAAAGQTTRMFPFTNQSTVSIPWTTTLLAQFGNSPTIQVYHETSPDVFQLVDVQVQQLQTAGILQSIEIDNGGAQTGYVLIS